MVGGRVQNNNWPTFKKKKECTTDITGRVGFNSFINGRYSPLAEKIDGFNVYKDAAAGLYLYYLPIDGVWGVSDIMGDLVLFAYLVVGSTEFAEPSAVEDGQWFIWEGEAWTQDANITAACGLLKKKYVFDEHELWHTGPEGEGGTKNKKINK